MADDRTQQSISIKLSLRIYGWLLSLGPDEYQQRYGQPTLQVFLQCCRDVYRVRGAWGVVALWPRMYSEAVIGMVAEQLNAQGKLQQMQPIMRRSIVITFSAFMLFFLAFAALMRLTDPRAPFNAVADAHPEIKLAFALINNGAIIALLTIIVGGLPLLFAACKHMIEQKRNPLRLFLIRPGRALALFCCALLFTIVFMIYSAGMNWLVGAPILGAPDPKAPLFVVFLVLIALGLITSVLIFCFLAVVSAFSLAITRSEFGERLLRFSLIPMTITTVAMGVTVLATFAWIFWLYVYAPEFARSGDGLGQGNLAWLVAIVFAMLLAIVTAVSALKQGLEARGLTKYISSR